MTCREPGVVAVPAAATAANLARRPFLTAERGLSIERRRDDLRATLLRALDVLADGLTGGPYEHDALRYMKEALALDPYRETSFVQLIHLHMSQGNRAERSGHTSNAVPFSPTTSA